MTRRPDARPRTARLTATKFGSFGAAPRISSAAAASTFRRAPGSRAGEARARGARGGFGGAGPASHPIFPARAAPPGPRFRPAPAKGAASA